jgi:hypothetical protein
MPLFDGKVSKRKKGYDDDSDDDNDGGERMLEYFVHLEGASTDDATAYRKLKQCLHRSSSGGRRKMYWVKFSHPKIEE